MALVLKRNESVLRIASSKLKRYSWKELAQRLPLAMRTYQGQTPIPEERSNFSKPEFTSNLKHNRSSAKPEISVVLLETSNCGYGTYVLDMLVSQQTLNRQLFEVVWIGANPTIPMALCSKTDVALHQKQHHYWENGCVNKCRALNSGAIHSGSEIVVLVESDFLIGPDFLSNVYEQRDNIRNSGCFVSTIARAAGKESGPSIAYSLAVSKQWFLKLHGLDEDDRFLMDSNGSTAEFLTRFLKAGGQLLHKPDFMGVLPFPQPQTPGLLIKSVQCTSSNQIPDNQAFPKVHSTDLLEFLEKVE
jgi:hypothetical protein